MIRVIGHELNNSLAPITSLTGSMERLVRRDPLPDDWQSDGCGVSRSSHRGFIAQPIHDRLLETRQDSRTDPATRRRGRLRRRVAELEKRLPVRVLGGPDVTVPADQDQLEQVLINLVRNAIEASTETQGMVEVDWAENGKWLDITVRDEGSGLADPESLFIPFYTTKATGSGIGLFLCRHVAEAHGGSVMVRNRNNHPGCEAVLRIPTPWTGLGSDRSS